jgi:hypothetical protein
MRIKVLSSTLIRVTLSCHCAFGCSTYFLSVEWTGEWRPSLAGIIARQHSPGFAFRIEGDGVELVVARRIDCKVQDVVPAEAVLADGFAS